jgi:hypothetical protein
MIPLPQLLFHGSDQVIDEPRLIKKNKRLDFGPGFCLTADKEHAELFAKLVVERRMNEEHPSQVRLPVLNSNLCR